MTYISSDTSVWIDYVTIDGVELPFRLPYTYVMNEDAIADELLSPRDLGERLVACGLVPVEITMEEFVLAEEYGARYKRLSKYDRIALAIAKCRDIILLTGDGALRKAANKEKVKAIGTLGILDQLWEHHQITVKEYKMCLRGLLDNNGGAVRLPEEELRSRLARIFDK